MKSLLIAVAVVVLAGCSGSSSGSFDEKDPHFTESASSNISADQIAKWDQAAARTETDPNFAASPAATLTTAKMDEWNTAYGWGDHAQAGYLKTESEPQFTASAASGITAGKIANWDTAYGWGDHAAAGYMNATQFAATPASTVTAGDITNWDTAYGWGNHATAGYLTTESDPKVGSSLTNKFVPHWNGTSLANGRLQDDGTTVTVTPNAGSAVQDQSCTTALSSAQANAVWQSFTAGQTGQLTKITVGQTNFGASFSGTLNVYVGQGTAGTKVFTQAVTSFTGGNFTFNLTNGPSLVTGKQYTFELTTGLGINYRYDTSNTYAGGVMNGVAGNDLVFATFMITDVTTTVANNGRVGIGIAAPARTLHLRDVMRLEPQFGPPSGASEGDLYYDGTLHKLRYFDGTAWVSL